MTLLFFFFFFQAEDGIRDYKVTGVQTCALPIWDRIMTAEQFVAELDAQNQSLLSRLAPDDTLRPEVEGDLNVPNLLRVALRNELEATEIAARWLVTTDAADVKLALARQVGDEAKHYRMIAERLRALGGHARSFDPLANGGGAVVQS